MGGTRTGTGTGEGLQKQRVRSDWITGEKRLKILHNTEDRDPGPDPGPDPGLQPSKDQAAEILVPEDGNRSRNQPNSFQTV